MYVYIFSKTLSQIIFILQRSERDIIKNVRGSSCRVPVIIVWFLRKINFLLRFSKKTQIPNFIKINPVGAELFHADRRTDKHDKVNSRFS